MVDNSDNVVLRAIEECARLKEITPTAYVENVMAKIEGPNSLMVREAREAISGIRDPEKYEEFQRIYDEIKAGKNLPLGIILTEQAVERGLPSVMVTSTSRHSLAFEPIKDLIKVPCIDTLVNDRKDWASGIVRITNGGRR